MSASAVFILDVKGKPLISRNYKGDVPMSKIEHFMPLLVQREEEGALTPLLSYGEVHFLWIKHSNLYRIHPLWRPWRRVCRDGSDGSSLGREGGLKIGVAQHICVAQAGGQGKGQVEMGVVARDKVEVQVVATTLKNANASLVYSFLYKTIEVFCEYFKELEEESIRDNFVIVYELLDELMDFGFPQTTDSKILQEYITQQSNKLETGKSRVPPTVTNAVSWRSEGIKYKKNEVFIDVIESVNLLVNANGSVLLSEIVGSIKLKVFLSGMPELRLGLNDRVLFELTGRSKNKSVELEDVKFHQCVRLSRFDNDRTISFIPPDGDFELMSYRLSTQVKPLIWIESVIEKFSHSRVEIMVKAKGQFKKQSVANGVEISVPVPSDADSPRFKTSVGSAKYVPEKNVVIWSIKSFPGGKEYLMRAHFGLPSVEKEEVEGRPPIGVKFEIPYFTVSGIQVREADGEVPPLDFGVFLSLLSLGSSHLSPPAYVHSSDGFLAFPESNVTSTCLQPGPPPPQPVPPCSPLACTFLSLLHLQAIHHSLACATSSPKTMSCSLSDPSPCHIAPWPKPSLSPWPWPPPSRNPGPPLFMPFQVRYMKIIEKSGYQALPWVRYITQSGDYQLRTS
ncbi:AP-1 complex subunit mu-2 [Saguinus oedipus]|uniref:AP-1 complex subunit mu-2 n=1 Tax=Saguinus oedipus TaxID=9490 RepID=A0ABQ9TSH8_SAGOE|nr:AP-1 complex subunit mu-2 [Saguinus oedipus]